MEKIFQEPRTYNLAKGLFEYILIVSPGKDVYDKVMEEKRYFCNNYQPVAIKTKPHITLSSFLAWDSMEDSLIHWLQRIASQHRSFDVTLNNYSGFPSHTVYIRIQNPVPFKMLASKLEAIAPYIKTLTSKTQKFSSYPHISIARKLPADVYENAIKDYSEKDFNASFNVSELVLLRRQHQFDKCKEIGIFRLLPNDHNNN